jgi:hypothetical protein
MTRTAHFMKILRKWLLSQDGNGETSMANNSVGGQVPAQFFNLYPGC